MQRFPLRYFLPLVLLLFGVVQAVFILWISSVRIEANLNKDSIRRLQTEMTRLQGTLQFLVKINQREQIQAEMSALGSDSHLIIAILFDENNIALNSNKFEYRNTSFDDLMKQFQNKNIGNLKTQIDEVRQRLRGKIWIKNSGSRIICGVYPILLANNHGNLRPNKIGVLYIEKDLAFTDNLVKRELLEQAFVVLAVLLLISIVIVILLNRHITKRIERLVTVTSDFAAGNSFARSDINGSDEIAKLANAFDNMADQVTASQERLKSLNQRLQLIMDSTAEAIFGIDTDAICVFANNACLNLLGCRDVSELVGVNMRAVISNQALSPDRPQHSYEGRMFLPLIEGTPRHVENETLFRKDGSSFNSEYWSYPLKENNKVVGVVVSILDISSRIEALHELSQYQNNLETLVTQRTKQLELSNKELSSYSYSIAHDLRTPLRAVTSFSQILQEDAGNKLNESELDALNRIVCAGKHMAQLIDDILDLSKLSRSNLQVEPIDLVKLANTVFDNTKQNFPHKSASLVIPQKLSINGDRTLLTLVFENLFVNAMKYHNGDSIEIEVGGSAHANQMEYFVRDNGIGFDMRFAQKIFKPFERLHNLSDYSGTGVGLSIVKRIIERHGGRIWVVSKPNQGSTFYFSIPSNIQKHMLL